MLRLVNFGGGKIIVAGFIFICVPPPHFLIPNACFLRMIFPSVTFLSEGGEGGRVSDNDAQLTLNFR